MNKIKKEKFECNTKECCVSVVGEYTPEQMVKELKWQNKRLQRDLDDCRVERDRKIGQVRALTDLLSEINVSLDNSVTDGYHTRKQMDEVYNVICKVRSRCHSIIEPIEKGEVKNKNLLEFAKAVLEMCNEV